MSTPEQPQDAATEPAAPESEEERTLVDVMRDRKTPPESEADTKPEEPDAEKQAAWDRERQARDQAMANREKAAAEKEATLAVKERELEELRAQLTHAGEPTDRQPADDAGKPGEEEIDLTLPEVPDADDLANWAANARKMIVLLEQQVKEGRKEVTELREGQRERDHATAYQTNVAGFQKAVNDAVALYGEDHREAITEGTKKSFVDNFGYEDGAFPAPALSNVAVKAVAQELGLEKKTTPAPKPAAAGPGPRLDTGKGGGPVKQRRRTTGGGLEATKLRMIEENPGKYRSDELGHTP